MSLLPYVLDQELSLRPRSIYNQLLGSDLSPEDFLTEVFDRPARHLRPWRNLSSCLARDVGSTIKTDKDKFQVNLDVQHFSPEEISVKITDKYIVVEGKHEEKKDEHGFVTRQFKRRYALPDDCKAEAVESKLSSDGVLTIIAPKLTLEKEERVVPISQTGPVRRKLRDTEEKRQQNGEDEEVSTESSQKKKKR